jgi:hypothetical protein
MRIVQKRPINAEPPPPLLTHSWLTPNSIWFVRNHHPVPKVLDSLGISLSPLTDRRQRLQHRDLHPRVWKKNYHFRRIENKISTARGQLLLLPSLSVSISHTLTLFLLFLIRLLSPFSAVGIVVER